MKTITLFVLWMMVWIALGLLFSKLSPAQAQSRSDFYQLLYDVATQHADTRIGIDWSHGQVSGTIAKLGNDYVCLNDADQYIDCTPLSRIRDISLPADFFGKAGKQ